MDHVFDFSRNLTTEENITYLPALEKSSKSDSLDKLSKVRFKRLIVQSKVTLKALKKHTIFKHFSK